MLPSFNPGPWLHTIDVRDFLLKNMTAYEGDYSFLADISNKTDNLWKKCQDLIQQEHAKGGILDIDTETISTITSHPPGYIHQPWEVIVGLQTDAPLKRAIKPFGGWRIVAKACEENGYQLSPTVIDLCQKYRKTHNDGVFDAYTTEMRAYRKAGVITGLPDNYARGRIIGDYRRVALYGTTALIESKKADLEKIMGEMSDEVIRLREEVNEQIRALLMITDMAKSYGFDISQPAQTAQEAVQWTYFAYLAALKEHDGAAMSLGNVSGFFDVYIERDIAAGLLDESGAQELVDQFVMKLRLIRHLRMDEYNQLFSGDPTWLTESLGGLWLNGHHKVTKTSYRFLHTLYNLGPAPEPNLTVLWSQKLPENFKNFCTKVSIDTSSIQYENDDVMREISDYDDYGISCCVSQLRSGKDMQFFGARCNLAKTLLLAINEGCDEINGARLVNGITPLSSTKLTYAEVWPRFLAAMKEVVRVYVSTMNVIHYMHDKYYYERAQMSLIDTDVRRLMAFGIAGLSVAADSLSAIKYASVTVERDDKGFSKDFHITGDFPKYGNDDDRVDDLAKEMVTLFNDELHQQYLYRHAEPTLSVLTITSNVVYGKKTGATPDGRAAGVPFAPGANPMHGRDTHGAIASLNSVAKLSYNDARDGISNTFSIVPRALGANQAEQIANLRSLLDGYFAQKAHHLNVNVLNRDLMLEAMDHPEKYPQLTIRVSGYAVNFVKLTREQQQEVLARTFFETL